MSRYEPIADLLQKDRSGHTLPRELYVTDAAFEFDAQVMLKSVWLYACTVAHVKQPGDYFVFELGSKCGRSGIRAATAVRASASSNAAAPRA
jgi:Rieske 2Fe-2S family protein